MSMDIMTPPSPHPESTDADLQDQTLVSEVSQAEQDTSPEPTEKYTKAGGFIMANADVITVHPVPVVAGSAAEGLQLDPSPSPSEEEEAGKRYLNLSEQRQAAAESADERMQREMQEEISKELGNLAAIAQVQRYNLAQQSIGGPNLIRFSGGI